jgi:NAD(P)-dependent dehydrogenase (short-subunit alcohol dehydrogenase family)
LASCKKLRIAKRTPYIDFVIMKGEIGMRLENKVAIITEAGSGIGGETSLLFAKEGAKVVVADVVEKAGEETVAEIKKIGARVFAKMDVTKGNRLIRWLKTLWRNTAKLAFRSIMLVLFRMLLLEK